MWRPKHIFNYIQWKSINPDFVVDISDFMDKKIEACLAYETQFYNPNSEEPMTPISTKDFWRVLLIELKIWVDYLESPMQKALLLKN